MSVVFQIIEHGGIRKEWFTWNAFLPFFGLLAYLFLQIKMGELWGEIRTKTNRFKELYAQALAEMGWGEWVIGARWTARVRVRPDDPWRSGVLVATSQRILFASGKRAEGLVFSFPYPAISDFRHVKYAFRTKIRFRAFGETVKINRVDNDSGEILWTVEEGMAGRLPVITE